MSFDDDTTEAHERRIVRCRGKTCRARIIFLETRSGKKIPVDADTVEPDDEVYEHGRHVPHHSSCPDVEDFRR